MFQWFLKILNVYDKVLFLLCVKEHSMVSFLSDISNQFFKRKWNNSLIKGMMAKHILNSLPLITLVHTVFFFFWTAEFIKNKLLFILLMEEHGRPLIMISSINMYTPESQFLEKWDGGQKLQGGRTWFLDLSIILWIF